MFLNASERASLNDWSEVFSTFSESDGDLTKYAATNPDNKNKLNNNTENNELQKKHHNK